MTTEPLTPMNKSRPDVASSKLKKHWKWGVAGLCIVAAGLVYKNQQDSPKMSPSTSATQAANVVAMVLSKADYASVALQNYDRALPFSANIRAIKDGQVGAEIGGVVRQVLVREGEMVKKGQVLAMIESTDVVAQYQAQQANVDTQKSRVELAKTKRDKYRILFEKGFISDIALAEYENDYRSSLATYQSQMAQLGLSKKSRDDAQVRAPITGVVYRSFVHEGDLITQNKALFAVADLTELEAVSTLSAQNIGRVQVGGLVSFATAATVDKADARRYTGRIARINPVADPNTRSFAIYIHIDNQDQSLKSGEFVQGSIVTNHYEKAVVVPVSALRKDPNLATYSVMVIDKNQQLVARPVELAFDVGEEAFAVIHQGLAVGERYLSSNLAGLRVGSRVSFAEK